MTSQTTAGVGAGLALTLTMAAHGGLVLFVDDDAPLDGDGATWPTAYRFLQDALTEASGGGITEIRIAQGIYRPDRDEANPDGTGNREATFQLINALSFIGGYAGLGAPDPDARDIDLYETILSGDLLADDGSGFANNDENSFHVVTALEVNATAILDGFTVTAGRADGPNYGPSPKSQDQGSAVNVYFAGPRLINCTFRSNWALNHGTVNDHGTATLIGCTFRENYSINLGAGLYIHHDATAIVTDCGFYDNTTPGRGGGAYNKGSTAATFTDCAFSNNSAGRGGGMYNAPSSSTSLTNCSFSLNSAYYGAGMYNEESTPTVTDCSLMDNSAIQGGAGVYNNASNAMLISCTFVGNESASSYGSGAGMYSDADSGPMLTDCTFNDNSAGTGGGVVVSGTAVLSNCTFTDNSGGGVSAAGSATIIDCTFTGNSAVYGGAMRLSGSPTVINCAFANNSATFRGGALYTLVGTPLLVNCTVTDNTSEFAGGGMFNAEDGDPTLMSCVLKSNTADFGGGMHNFKGSPTLTNCILIANTAKVWGGAMYNAFGGVALTNCRITGNSAFGKGGGLHNFQCSPTLANCTVSLNSAGEDGGGIFNQLNANPALANCILWLNTDSGPPDESAQVFHLAASQSVVNYSCIQGITGDLGGVGNIGDDPQFVDPDGADNIPGTEDDDLRLQRGSPCIDAASNNAVPPDTADLDDDGDTTEFTPLDLDGNPRFANDPGALDTGCGVPVIVDMGAYEFPGDVVQPRRGDLDGDGSVGVADLLILLSSWGPCDNGCCLADLNTNDTVGVLDLLILLSNWGA